MFEVSKSYHSKYYSFDHFVLRYHFVSKGIGGSLGKHPVDLFRHFLPLNHCYRLLPYSLQRAYFMKQLVLQLPFESKIALLIMGEEAGSVAYESQR